MRAEQLQHAAGAGAEVEQRAERLVGQRLGDRRLDRDVGDVELPDAIPFGGVLAEVGLRGGGARSAHGGEALAIAHDHRIVVVEPRQKAARHVGGGGVLGHAEEGPAAFAKALHQAGLGKKLEMARDARL
jgi:hypothetical protein